MYLRFSPNPKFSAEVKVLQLRLNAIKYNVHGSWPVLAADGLYGPETCKAVKGFQIYKGIIPATGTEVGDTTWRYINDAYNHVPMIKPASEDFTPYYDTRGLSDRYPLLKAFDYVGDFLGNLDDFIGREVSHVTTMGKAGLKSLQGTYINFATQWDPKMRELKQFFQKNINSQKAISQNASQAKVRVDTVRTYNEYQKIQQAQRTISYAQRDLRINTPKAKAASMDLASELKKFNLLDKIEKYLKSKGLSGEVKIDALKNFKISGNVKIGAGTYLKVWNYKDIIEDIFNYEEWGTERWKKKFIDDIYKALDAIIIGYASAVIAELLVGAVVALVGATISVGWIVVIVAFVAIIVAALIGFLLEKADFSFSEYAIQGYKYIAEYAMILF